MCGATALADFQTPVKLTPIISSRDATLHRLIELPGGPDVGRDRQRPPVERLDLGDCLVQVGLGGHLVADGPQLRGDIGDDHVGALPGAGHGVRPALPA
jgi:hypothetical protein